MSIVIDIFWIMTQDWYTTTMTTFLLSLLAAFYLIFILVASNTLNISPLSIIH